MKILLAIAFCLINVSAFAQDLSGLEDFRNSYISLNDGSSRYIGRCSTHEVYKGFFFKITNVIQKYFEPYEVSSETIDNFIKKIDPKLLNLVFEISELNTIVDEPQNIAGSIKEYFDDITVEEINHTIFSDLSLIRFNLGVGGGNGMYLIFNKTKNGEYELMSETMDGDVHHCDKKVWLMDQN